MTTMEVYEAGSTLVINGSGMTGIVEKAVIGSNKTVTYQLICYTPERHPQVVQEYEVSPVEGKVNKTRIGFTPTPIEIPKSEVSIIIDEDNNILDIDSSDGIMVSTNMIPKDEYAKLIMERDRSQEGDYEAETEKDEKEKES